MKKITFFLLSLLITTFAFGQNGSALITGYVNSSDAGTKIKALEIYVEGTVDFKNWGLLWQVDGKGYNLGMSLTSLGVVSNEFVYLTNNAARLKNIFGINPEDHHIIETGYIADDGDGGFQIVDAIGKVVDRFGVPHVDGGGTAWEHEESYYYRKDGVTANGGQFNPENWIIGAPHVFDDQAGNFGQSSLSHLVAFGSFHPTLEKTRQLAGAYANMEVKIYPNPATTYVRVWVKGLAHVDIFSVLGQRVNSIDFLNSASIPVSDLNSGMYLVKVIQNGESVTKKLVIK